MAAQEDLEARMEKIRIKNEELEKKHKEALDDLNAAKANNCAVNLTPSSENWEKGHRYDNLEGLDFDVAEKDKVPEQEQPDVTDKKNQPILSRSGKELNDLPADPAYNFLRDDDRDNKPRAITNNQQQRPNNKKPFNKNRNRQERPRSDGGDGIGGSPDGFARQHQQEHRQQRPRNPRPAPQNQMQSEDSVPSQRKPIHPQQLRNERRSVPNDGPSQQHNQSGSSPLHQQQRQNKQLHSKKETPRTNITVSIGDGEVRSVKPGEKTFGSGRVAHSRPEKIQKYPSDNTSPDNANDSGDKGQQDRSSRNRNNHNRRNHQKNKQPNPEFQHPILEKITISKTSVQERLMRSKLSDSKDAEPNIVVPSDA